MKIQSRVNLKKLMLGIAKFRGIKLVWRECHQLEKRAGDCQCQCHQPGPFPSMYIYVRTIRLICVLCTFTLFTLLEWMWCGIVGEPGKAAALFPTCKYWIGSIRRKLEIYCRHSIQVQIENKDLLGCGGREVDKIMCPWCTVLHQTNPTSKQV